MNKIFIFLTSIIIGTSIQAEDISTDAVLLQALDKTTGRTSFLTVKVDTPYTFGDLTIEVKKCLKRPPEETPEDSVFMTVQEGNNNIFKGWMFSSNPALSAMEHPVYDIWVIECNQMSSGAKTPLEVIDIDETENFKIDNVDN